MADSYSFKTPQTIPGPCMRLRVLELMGLEAGWLDGQGEAMTQAAAQTALMLADAVIIARVSPAVIFPEVAGGYQFEWLLATGDSLLDVIAQIQPNGDVWWFGDASKIEVDVTLKAADVTCKKLITVMSRIGFCRLPEGFKDG